MRNKNKYVNNAQLAHHGQTASLGTNQVGKQFTPSISLIRPFKYGCQLIKQYINKQSFFLNFSIWLDVPHLTNEHRTQDCIAS